MSSPTCSVVDSSSARALSSDACTPGSVGTSDDSNFVMTLDCGYDDGPHEYPLDWQFGGPYLNNPQGDPRWMPTTYQYHDEQLQVIHVTQTPLCDEQAIDEFTQVTSFGRTFKPVFLTVRRHGEEKFVMLPVKYDPATDTASDV